MDKATGHKSKYSSGGATQVALTRARVGFVKAARSASVDELPTLAERFENCGLGDLTALVDTLAELIESDDKDTAAASLFVAALELKARRQREEAEAARVAAAAPDTDRNARLAEIYARRPTAGTPPPPARVDDVARFTIPEAIAAVAMLAIACGVIVIGTIVALALLRFAGG